MSRSWSLFAGIDKIDVKSHLVAAGANKLTTTIDFRPWTDTVGAYCRF